jgi:hypothetical protein
MLDVVDLFREHDTRDELGIGSGREAFADMLFPGPSTIMTRARYFLLFPWAYQRLERLRVRSTEIGARAAGGALRLRRRRAGVAPGPSDGHGVDLLWEESVAERSEFYKGPLLSGGSKGRARAGEELLSYNTLRAKEPSLYRENPIP